MALDFSRIQKRTTAPNTGATNDTAAADVGKNAGKGVSMDGETIGNSTGNSTIDRTETSTGNSTEDKGAPTEVKVPRAPSNPFLDEDEDTDAGTDSGVDTDNGPSIPVLTNPFLDDEDMDEDMDEGIGADSNMDPSLFNMESQKQELGAEPEEDALTREASRDEVRAQRRETAKSREAARAKHKDLISADNEYLDETRDSAHTPHKRDIEVINRRVQRAHEVYIDPRMESTVERAKRGGSMADKLGLSVIPEDAIKGSKPGDKWKQQSTPVNELRFPGDNRAMKQDEKKFYLSVDDVRRRQTEGYRALELFRPPVGRSETRAQREEREAKISAELYGIDYMKAGWENRSRRFNWKDAEMLEFLALMRFSSAKHLAEMFSEKPSQALYRLNGLESVGIVKKKEVYGIDPLWSLTNTGVLLSGYDAPVLDDRNLTYTMFPHNFNVNHIAANVWGGGLNVLNQDDFPVKNRKGINGEPRYGDYIQSEFFIRSAMGKLFYGKTAEEFRPMVDTLKTRLFRDWENNGGAEHGPSPELVWGNDWLWTVYPPAIAKISYHVPDLVVRRERNPDGSPESIAVELELANKSESSYRSTIMAYKYDDLIYKKVVWACRNRAAASKIMRAAYDLGCEDKVEVVPIMTKDGLFGTRDPWLI